MTERGTRTDLGILPREGFKLLVPHAPVCYYLLKEEDSHRGPFVLHDGMEWRRRKNGDKGGSIPFHRFRCNDINCPAIALVRIDILADWIGRV